MAVYEYRCPACGPLEITRPMGAAAPETACPTCGGDARRLFSPPLLARTPKPLAAARSRAERSAHEPEVVTRVPPRARPRPAAPPQPRLPRPRT